MIYLHTKFHIYSSSDSLVNAKKFKEQFSLPESYFTPCRRVPWRKLPIWWRSITMYLFRIQNHVALMPPPRKSPWPSCCRYWFRKLEKHDMELSSSAAVAFMRHFLQVCQLLQRLKWGTYWELHRKGKYWDRLNIILFFWKARNHTNRNKQEEISSQLTSVASCSLCS
jgi:hypothetical protein